MSKSIVAISLIIFFFSGCISVTKELPPFSTYTLFVDKTSIKYTKKIPYSVGVLEPKAINSINNILLSYSDDNFTSESYVLSKWSDKPTKMLQQMMVNYLSETNNYTYVHSNKLGIPSDIQIASELDSFTQYLEKDKAYIEFTLRVFLVQKEILHTKKFSYKYLCDDQSAKSSVKALNKAVNPKVRIFEGYISSV